MNDDNCQEIKSGGFHECSMMRGHCHYAYLPVMVGRLGLEPRYLHFCLSPNNGFHVMNRRPYVPLLHSL